MRDLRCTDTRERVRDAMELVLWLSKLKNLIGGRRGAFSCVCTFATMSYKF